MIETTILEYLGQLDVPVYAEIPDDATSPLVVVQRTGGGQLSPGIDTAMVVVQCYADSLYKTAELAYRVRDLMEDFNAIDGICRCALNAGPYEYNHPTRREYRYQIVYDIIYYREEI